MSAYIVQRLIHAVVVLLGISIITFLMINLSPGGPSIMTTMETTLEARQALTKRLGLDEPLHLRYFKWIGAILRGDFGRSFNDGRPVIQVITARLQNTLLLTLVALGMAVVLGIPIGVYSATHPSSFMDYLITLVSFIGISIPIFWLGIMLIFVFSVTLGWLPSSGMVTLGKPFSFPDLILHLIMPAMTLSAFTLATVVRYTRSSMLDVLNEDYIKTAYAKGQSTNKVVHVHGLRNAIIPVVTVIGMQLRRVVGGTVITETIFGWPGMGRLALNSALDRDYPVIMGVTVIVGVGIILGNLLVDLTYGLLDPRIKYD